MVTLRTQPLLYIVDGNEVVRNVLTGIFDEEIAIRQCVDGKSLMQSLKDNAKPSVILMDIGMPKLNGLKVITALKQHDLYKDYPVVFISGHENKQVECKCLKDGAVDYIKKPFDVEIVHQRVMNIIEQYRMYLSITSIFTPEKEVRQNFANLDDAYKKATYQMLSALSTAIDAKDYYTRGHSSRVAEYSGYIGRAMNLSEKELDVLYHCALLHDIGKIGVSDLILRKEGRLTDAEYEIIKNHSVLGYDILKNITLMPDIARSARWHHERYDGCGYPDGLSGEGIPTLARIITVADSYDAMTSDRAYRKGMAPEAALAELKANKGTQFDPHIADIMIEGILRKDKM